MEYTPSVTGLKQLVNWNKNDNWDPEMRLDVDQTRYWDFIIERMELPAGIFNDRTNVSQSI